MNHLKKILLGLAATAALVLFGTVPSFAAQCSKTPIGSAPNVRAEGTIEKLGVITIDCSAATDTPTAAEVAANPVTTIAVTMSPTATKVTAGSGVTTPAVVGAATTTCSVAGAPDFKSTFPCPSLSSWTTLVCAQSVGTSGGCVPGAAFSTAPTATISGNTVLFSFEPPVAGGASVFYAIAGIRANVATSGLGTGGALQAAVARGGTFIGKSDNVLVGFVNVTLSSTSGFGTTALAIPACGPTVATPVGTPLTLAANPDVAGINSLKVTLQNGFAASFTNNQFSDGLAAPPVGSGGIGVRFRILLTGLPSGMSVYAPEQLAVNGAGSAAGSAAVAAAGPGALNVSAIPGVSAAATGTFTTTSAGVGAPSLVLTLVGTSPNLDGSGGTLVTAVANQYDLIPIAGGTVAITYETTTASSIAGVDTVIINIALTGSGSVGTGAVSGVLSPGPVGPPTLSAAVPQFAAGKASVVANVAICQSFLLFPWIVNTGDGQYDTGLTVSNTTADPAAIGTTGQTGDVTLYFFPSDGSAPFSQSMQVGVKPGQTATMVISSGLKKVFTGYVFAVCGFNLAHGVEFITNPIAGGNGFAQGYTAISVSSPRIPTPATPPQRA